MSKRQTRNCEVPVTPALDLEIETLAIRAGHERTHELEHSEALFLTSSFVFNSAEEAAERFSGKSPGNVFSRFSNPTVRMFEQRIAAMEGGERAVALASGMSAIVSTCIALLKAGDHVVCSRSVFGTTVVIFEKYLKKFGVECTFVDLPDLQQWEAAIQPNTRMLFLETPSNPLGEVADIRRLSELAKSRDILLVVDNCFCTPVLQRPLELGADIVIHSATKYLDGQGRCVGGVVVGPNQLMEEVYGFLRSGGPTMSPFNAWVFLKGLEVLGVRMRAHCENAQRIAEWLEAQPLVEKVFYGGLPSHPQHELAKQQQSGFGGIVSFRIKGGREEAWRFINGTRLISITANLGDVKTTITHPATTTHGRVSPEARAQAGITENLMRLSIGLESVTDLQEDLARGFAAVQAAPK